MEILAKLTPAETYLIKENSKVLFKDLLKFTLIDLILKKVIISEDIDFQSHPQNPIRKIKHLRIGPNFSNYKFKQHELPFAQPFLKEPTLDIMFRHLVKMGYENAGSLKSYVFDRILVNEEPSKAIKNTFFKRLMVYFTLTNYGKNLKDEIDSAIQGLEKSLPELIESDKQEALKILTTIHGNIFLLKSLDFKLLEKIDEELSEEMKRSKGSDGWSGCSGCFVYYDSYDRSFSEGFDSSDSGGSGCGASGCSGCGGCGGCGG